VLIWYLSRGAGIAAYATLSVATAAGALASRRGDTRRAAAIERRVVLQYLHRSAALTGLALLALHIVTIAGDSYAHVGTAGALLPFASGYRPVAVTFGLLAAYLLVAVALTGLLRSRFARSGKALRRWRGVHLVSYAAWAAAAWHFWTAGSDAHQQWARQVLLAGVAAVALGVTVRLSGRPAEPALVRGAPARQETSIGGVR